eukprot:SAG25_NODE_1176_length_3692_cov_2.811578_4_plen_65_part_00
MVLQAVRGKKVVHAVVVWRPRGVGRLLVTLFPGIVVVMGYLLIPYRQRCLGTPSDIIRPFLSDA